MTRRKVGTRAVKTRVIPATWPISKRFKVRGSVVDCEHSRAALELSRRVFFRYDPTEGLSDAEWPKANR